MIAEADIGDYRDVATVEAKAFAQHSAARRLEHRRVDPRM